MNLNDFGNKLRALRGEKTQDEIARALGISQSHYARLEGGDVTPTTVTIFKIAEVFAVSAGEVFKHLEIEAKAS